MICLANTTYRLLRTCVYLDHLGTRVKRNLSHIHTYIVWSYSSMIYLTACEGSWKCHTQAI